MSDILSTDEEDTSLAGLLSKGKRGNKCITNGGKPPGNQHDSREDTSSSKDTEDCTFTTMPKKDTSLASTSAVATSTMFEDYDQI